VIGLLAALSIAGNVLTLWLPKTISHAIDSYARHNANLTNIALLFGAVSGGIFALVSLQTVLQVFASERVARDIRNQLTAKISSQSYAFVQDNNPSKLLTYLTSDMDSIKLFVSQAIVSVISSIVIIVGASVLLIQIDWKLALATLTIVPLIGVSFFLVFRKVSKLFLVSRGVIDKLNKVINESILGAPLIRVVNASSVESAKFKTVNAESRDVGYSIVRLFAALVPAISFFAQMATIVILLLGGKFVIDRSLSFGDYAAFSSYIGILIFPILVLGFISNIIAQANASFARISTILDAPDAPKGGTIKASIKGNFEVNDLEYEIAGKEILKDISFKIKAGSKTAIIGPTAAGKSQLLYAMCGLTSPTSGTIKIDGHDMKGYDKQSLHSKMGFVFQDSIVFNLSLRENVAFSPNASDDSLKLALSTAELHDMVESQPQGLDTIISERGTSLSGGQKQRLMLARALAINPSVLLLDDFTARVDSVTEKKILNNVKKNYPGITLISVTQKIGAVEDYDQIFLLMEGELLASGKHKDLLKSSPEYMQIYDSQRSSDSYGL
jgi:ATP-binding cassette subfamily B protein